MAGILCFNNGDDGTWFWRPEALKFAHCLDSDDQAGHWGFDKRAHVIGVSIMSGRVGVPMPGLNNNIFRSEILEASRLPPGIYLTLRRQFWF